MEENIWIMHFGEASDQKGCKAGILSVLLEVAYTPIVVKVDFEVANNVA